ncbi:MAG: 5'-3' exonuclease H3TH domain-containing protein [Vulcanimicrobiota bacterium]
MKLYLIDALFHVFRSYYALPRSIRAEDGTPTNAVHGVLGILRNLWRTEGVTHVCVVFESLSGIFREEISGDYKAHREPPPADLMLQVPLVKEACRRLGLATWEVDGFEADDVIGTLARRCAEHGMGAVIVSNDKDLAQILAHPGELEILRTHGASAKARLERIRRENVPEVFGVEAFQIPSFLALRGDPVDNIAGLKGVGEKTAARWLAEGRTLQDLIADPDSLGKRWASVVRENVEGLLRDLELATIRDDIDLTAYGLDFNSREFEPKPIRGAAEFFRDLTMKRHGAEVENLETPRATVHDLWGP